MKKNMGTPFKTFIAVALTLSTAATPYRLAFANPFMEGHNAYEIGPIGRTIDDLKEFAKPNEMMHILPNRPIAARDKHGNRVYYTAGGKLAMRIGTDGSMQTSLQGMSIERDASGNLLRTTQTTKGTNQVVIKNDKGETIGYQDLGYGGKVLKEYDYQHNVTKTHEYDTYSKNTRFVLNELNQTRTVYNKNGTPAYDLNYEGTQIAWYEYDDKNRLAMKRDLAENRTYFDKNGNMTLTKDYRGNTVATYNYKKDDEGHWVLDTSFSWNRDTNKVETIIYYKNGKPLVEKDEAGAVWKDYFYDGQTLGYTINHKTNETEFYDRNGKTTHAMIFSDKDAVMAREYTYSKGGLAAVIDYSTGKTELFVHEQKVFSAAIVDASGNPMRLSAEVYQKMLDMKIIQKMYLKDNTYDQVHSVEIDGNSFIMQIGMKGKGESTDKKRLFHNGAELALYSWDETSRTMTLEIGGKRVVKNMESEPVLENVIQGIRDGSYK